MRNPLSLPALLLLCWTLLAGVTAAAADRGWPVSQLARVEGDVAGLGGRGGGAIARVSVSQMRVLYAVQQSIEAVAEMSAELLIVEGKQPNAFAGEDENGNAIVGINLAMLKLIDNDIHAAAALLGHEIAHLKLSHGERSAERDADTSMLGAVGGALLGSLGIPMAQTLSSLSVSAIQSNYSRDDEREADYLGAVWAVQAGYDPGGAWRLQDAIARGAGSGASSFFSTHPSGPERIETLKALADRLRPADTR